MGNPVLVQKVPVTAASNVTSFTGQITGVTPGNFLTVQMSTAISTPSYTGAPFSVPTDDNGTFTQALLTPPFSVSQTGLTGCAFQSGANGGTHNITIKAGGQTMTSSHATICEWSGMPPNYVVDQINSANSGSGSAISSGNITTTGSPVELILVNCMVGNGAAGVSNIGISDPPTGGFTSLNVGNNDLSDIAFEHAYKVTTSLGQYATTWSWTDNTGTTQSQAQIVSFGFFNAVTLGRPGQVGPAKLRLPPRSSDPTAVFSQPPQQPSNPFLVGPGVQPTSFLQFFTPPRSTDAKTTAIPIGGLSLSHSVIYGQLIAAPFQVGFVPQPGPGVGPFSNNQFLSQPVSNSNPSAILTAIGTGLMVSVSRFYASPAGSQGIFAGGIIPSGSLFYGNLSQQAQGAISGLMVSVSVVYGQASPIGSIAGVMVSNSSVQQLGIGGNFQPLIPMTATTDVRLKVGYQPWRVGKDDTIG